VKKGIYSQMHPSETSQEKIKMGEDLYLWFTFVGIKILSKNICQMYLLLFWSFL